jgi:hypothetical protein
MGAFCTLAWNYIELKRGEVGVVFSKNFPDEALEPVPLWRGAKSG